MMNNSGTKPIVMGLGNPLFQDEGLGIHVIHQLMKGELAGQANLIDGGTDGLSLLGIVEDAERLLIIDAIDGGFKPGTIKEWDGNQIPSLANGKISTHQLGFQEVIALAKMRGKIPSQMVLIGVQPASLDWGTQLTKEVAQSIPRIIEMVENHINIWLE